MNDSLATLFGTEARVKIMRLFLFNPDEVFDTEMVSRKSKVSPASVRSELRVLEKATLIRKKTFTKEVERKQGKKTVISKKKANGYELNPRFFHLVPLSNLLTTSKTLEPETLLKKLGKAGKLKLVLVAGVFTQDPESRVDLLVVGNQISKNALQNAIESIEAELGRELVYAFFETPDFQYRLNMYDKLVHDILDYPHRVLLDKLSA